MKQLLDTVAALQRVSATGESAVLATLMKVAGSAYSGPGATLLIMPDATVAGNLGASCFEQDLVGHARRVRASGAAELVRYDLTADDDKPWGLGMGCRGKLDLLLEPAPPGRVPEHLAFLVEAARVRQAAAVATLFRDTDSGSRSRASMHPRWVTSWSGFARPNGASTSVGSRGASAANSPPAIDSGATGRSPAL